MYIEHEVRESKCYFALFIVAYLLMNKVVTSMYTPPDVLYVSSPF